MLPLRMNRLFLSDFYLRLFFIPCIASLSWYLHCGHTVNTLPTLSSALRFWVALWKERKPTARRNLQNTQWHQLKSINGSNWLQNYWNSTPHFSPRSTWEIVSWCHCVFCRYTGHVWKPLAEYWALWKMSSTDGSTRIFPDSFICFSGYFTTTMLLSFFFFFSFLFKANL